MTMGKRDQKVTAIFDKVDCPQIAIDKKSHTLKKIAEIVKVSSDLDQQKVSQSLKTPKHSI